MTPTPQPTTPQPATPTLGEKSQGKRGSLGFENWVFWYHNNKADIENLKKALYSRVASENPLFQIGGRNLSNRSDATHDTRAKVKSTIIPALLRAMKAKKLHQDTQSAAYIALAKMAEDTEHIELIKKGLDLKLKPTLIVQESAAIALGMLRRGSPAKRFQASDLDQVRDFLFDVFQNDEYQARTRGFAALGIGLLGDQPSGAAGNSGEGASSSEGAFSGHARVTDRLFDLLKEKYNHPDLVIGVLTAIGLQPPPSLTDEHRDVLRECLAKGRLYKNDVQGITQSYAALTLGRIGQAKDIMVLQRAMTSRRNKDKNIQRSCAIGWASSAAS